MKGETDYAAIGKPPYPAGGELIFRSRWRLGSTLVCGSDEEHPSPFQDGVGSLVMVFGNRIGYRWLSDFFRWLSERPLNTSPDGPDPGDHVHLCDSMAPCNYALSDETDWTFDTITEESRDSLIACCKLTEATKNSGSLLEQFAAYLRDMVADKGPVVLMDTDVAMREIAELQLAAAEFMTAVAQRAKSRDP